MPTTEDMIASAPRVDAPAHRRPLDSAEGATPLDTAGRPRSKPRQRPLGTGPPGQRRHHQHPEGRGHAGSDGGEDGLPPRRPRRHSVAARGRGRQGARAACLPRRRTASSRAPGNGATPRPTTGGTTASDSRVGAPERRRPPGCVEGRPPQRHWPPALQHRQRPPRNGATVERDDAGEEHLLRPRRPPGHSSDPTTAPPRCAARRAALRRPRGTPPLRATATDPHRDVLARGTPPPRATADGPHP